MKEFKIRASAIGEIMAGRIGITEIQEEKVLELKAKSLSKPLTPKQAEELQKLVYKQEHPELPAGAKSYCEKWLKEQIYGKKKEFTSKFTDKGNAVEHLAFDMIGRHLGVDAIKNDVYYDNEFIEGTPDINTQELIDAKSSWDCFSFPLFEDEVPATDNYWQGQGYMDLTDKPNCKFVYVLCDTPESIIQREARNYCFNNGFEVTPEIMEEMRERLTYSGIDDKYKIKVFDIARNSDDIQKIYDRVKMCREYIKTIVV